MQSGIAVLFLGKDVVTNVSALPPVNLAVHDLKRSMNSVGKPGFQFNPQFTYEKAIFGLANPEPGSFKHIHPGYWIVLQAEGEQ